MITIQKSKSSLPEVDKKFIKLAVDKTLSEYHKEDVDVTVRLTNDKEIKKLNRDYRDTNDTTDVLSFNQDFQNPETGRYYLGDIIISLERVIEQAASHNCSINQECAFLAIHGTLHLLGYDHYSPEEKDKMWQLQDKIFFELMQDFPEKSA